MGLLADIRSKLISPKGRRNQDDSAAVAAAETALARLSSERDVAQAAIAAAADKRRALLLRDGTDDAISALEAETDAHHRTLERLDLLEPELLANLSAARGAQRQAILRHLAEEAPGAASRFAAALREAERRRLNVAELHAQADAAGVGHELRRVLEPAPWPFTNIDFLETYEVTTERRAAEFLRPPTAPPAPATVTARPPVAKAVPPTPPSPVSQKPPAPPPPPEGGGWREVMILRGGYPDTAGHGRTAGERIWLPPDVAQRAAQNGAVELISEDEK